LDIVVHVLGEVNARNGLLHDVVIEYFRESFVTAKYLKEKDLCSPPSSKEMLWFMHFTLSLITTGCVDLRRLFDEFIFPIVKQLRDDHDVSLLTKKARNAGFRNLVGNVLVLLRIILGTSSSTQVTTNFSISLVEMHYVQAFRSEAVSKEMSHIVIAILRCLSIPLERLEDIEEADVALLCKNVRNFLKAVFRNSWYKTLVLSRPSLAPNDIPTVYQTAKQDNMDSSKLASKVTFCSADVLWKLLSLDASNGVPRTIPEFNTTFEQIVRNYRSDGLYEPRALILFDLLQLSGHNSADSKAWLEPFHHFVSV
jgi:hypothetical protein